MGTRLTTGLRTIGLAVCAVAGACTSAPEAPAATQATIELTAKTLVDGESAVLMRPVDVAIGPDGGTFVADIGIQQLLVLDSTGTVIERIGREGSGPREFRFPRSLQVTRDSVYLVDVANARVLILERGGNGSRVVTALPGIGNAQVSFNASGHGVLARDGDDGVLAMRFDPEGNSTGGIGTPRVAASEGWDFAVIKSELNAGRVPQVLRNATLPVLGDDGTAWLVLMVDGAVERLTPQDSLQWTAALPDSLLVRLREDLFALNRADTMPGQFLFPTVVAAARAVGQDLWLLLREAEADPATIVVIDAEGNLRQRITIRGAEGARAFAVSPDRQRIVLLLRDVGGMVEARFPAGIR